MNRRLALATAGSLGALAGVMSLDLAAQAPQARSGIDAVAVAASVQSFYDRTPGLRAQFHQTYYHKLYDRYDRSRGEVMFRKPGRMRWNYAQPNGKVIVSDGQRVVVYEPGDGGDPGQMFEQELSQNQLPQAFSFLTGTGRLEQDFTFRLLDAQRQGFTEGFVLELRPRQPAPQYDRILFYVAQQEGRPIGVVRRVLIVDASGNRNRFDFTAMQFNAPAPDSQFRFSPPAGTRHVHP